MESTILQNNLLKNAATAAVAAIEVTAIGLLVLTAMSCTKANAETKQEDVYRWQNQWYRMTCEDQGTGAFLQAAEALRNADLYRKIIRGQEKEAQQEKERGLIPWKTQPYSYLGLKTKHN